VVVALDGRVVLDHDSLFHPSKSSDVTLGSNLLGGSTCRPNFSGTILLAQAIDPQSIH
jgi:hypothetical protein